MYLIYARRFLIGIADFFNLALHDQVQNCFPNQN